MESSILKYKPGDQIESFRLLKECGRGAYGTVFLAQSVVTGRRFALKIIPENDHFSRRELNGIVQYMEICPRSELMQVYHVGQCSGSLYYVMDAADDLDGGSGSDYLPDTLENRLKRQGRIPPEDLLTIAAQTERRLRFLHEKGLLHRDVKPGNILFIHGEAVPGDIGLLTGQPGSTLAGTPGFLSPEAAAGTRKFAPEDDFYALGKTVYCALTGYPPEKYPSFPPDLSLKDCRDVIALYNRWCAGRCAPVPPKKSRRKSWIRTGVLLLMASAAAAAGSFLLNDRGSPAPGPAPGPAPAQKQQIPDSSFCSVKDALRSAEDRIAAHVTPPGIVRLRPQLEKEKGRLWNERTRRHTAAYDRPVSPEERDQAARDPKCGIMDAETYVRVKRSDAASAAFDREYKDHPVTLYFKTLDWIANELDRLRSLASMPQLDHTDFSKDRVLFLEACDRLEQIEQKILRDPPFGIPPGSDAPR